MRRLIHISFVVSSLNDEQQSTITGVKNDEFVPIVRVFVSDGAADNNLMIMTIDFLTLKTRSVRHLYDEQVAMSEHLSIRSQFSSQWKVTLYLLTETVTDSPFTSGSS